MVDGVALPIHPFDPTAPEISRDKPLMVGWNEDEYTFFGLVSGDTAAFQLDETGLQERLNPQFGEDTNRIIDTFRRTRPDASPSDIFVAINSLSFAGFGSIYIAEKKAQQNGVAAYLYNFGYKSETKIPGTDYELGTPHAMDIAFKFNNVAPTEPGEENRSLGGNRPERLVASHNMAEMWTTFARSGKPGARGQPEWPPYTLPERPTMRIDTQCEVIYDRYREERQLWESLD